MKKLFATVGLLIFLIMGALAYQTLRSYAPQGEWEAPDTLSAYLFSDHPVAPKTDALIIWQKGEIIKEEYGRGFDKDSPHLLWSVSKSITSTLIGQAIHKNLIQLDDPIAKFYPDKESLQKSSEKAAITIDQLLTMSSGLGWQETYEHTGDRTLSSVGQMLYGERAAQDAVEYVLSHPLVHKPGTEYLYSTGEAVLLINSLKNIYGEAFDEMPWKELFDKLGMQNVTFEQDAHGQFLGGSSIFMRARDLLKFGQLHLQGGLWEGERILPEDWSERVWAVNPVYSDSQFRAKVSTPGSHWWTNYDPLKPGQVRNNGLPADTVFALGHWDQHLIIIPSLQTIVVRFGDDHYHELNQNHFYKLLAKELGL